MWLITEIKVPDANLHSWRRPPPPVFHKLFTLTFPICASAYAQEDLSPEKAEQSETCLIFTPGALHSGLLSPETSVLLRIVVALLEGGIQTRFFWDLAGTDAFCATASWFNVLPFPLSSPQWLKSTPSPAIKLKSEMGTLAQPSASENKLSCAQICVPN